jgi:predicted RNase H-like HicB family nuclease
MEFRAIIHEEDDSYWAEVEDLPGCFASGQDLDELKDALIEAIGMCLTEEDARRQEALEGLRVSTLSVASGPLVAAH